MHHLRELTLRGSGLHDVGEYHVTIEECSLHTECCTTQEKATPPQKIVYIILNRTPCIVKIPKECSLCMADHCSGVLNSSPIKSACTLYLGVYRTISSPLPFLFTYIIQAIPNTHSIMLFIALGRLLVPPFYPPGPYFSPLNRKSSIL